MKITKKNIGKAAIVLALTLAFVLPVTASTKTTGVMKMTNQMQPSGNIVQEPLTASALFEDNFDSYEDYLLDFSPWTQYDGDGQQTWGFEDLDFTNEYYTGSYIIFNPSMTQPDPLDDVAHSGAKYVACFDAVPTDILNDDWLITPQVSSGDIYFFVAIHCVNHDSFWLGIDDFSITEMEPGMINVSFWAKTGSSEYEPDRFQVGISIATNTPSDFKIITEDPYVEPPTNWTQYSYTVDLTDMIQQPELMIAVDGGLGVTATITNTGNAKATNCVTTFTISGGLILSPKGGVSTVTVGDIPENDTGSAKTMIIGIGKPTIVVDVTCDEGVTASSTYVPKLLLFFYIIG
jgi:hypothetical protein